MRGNAPNLTKSRNLQQPTDKTDCMAMKIQSELIDCHRHGLAVVKVQAVNMRSSFAPIDGTISGERVAPGDCSRTLDVIG
jgi:hypothetical protein